MGDNPSVNYDVTGVRAAEFMLANPDDAPQIVVDTVNNLQECREQLQCLVGRLSTFHRGLVKRQNLGLPMPPAEQLVTFVAGAQTLLMDGADAYTNFEENTVAEITIKNFAAPPVRLSDEEYLTKCVVNKVRGNTRELYCGLTIELLEELIKKDPVKARAMYDATLWAMMSLGDDKMPTTPVEALRLHEEHKASKGAAKKQKAKSDEPGFIPTIPDSLSQNDKKLAALYNCMVAAAKNGTHIAMRAAFVGMFPDNVPANMNLVETINELWHACKDALQGASVNNASVKTDATEPLARALSLVLMINANYQVRVPKDVKIKPVTQSELSSPPSSATKALVMVAVAPKTPGMVGGNGKEMEQLENADGVQNVSSEAAPVVNSPSEGTGADSAGCNQLHYIGGIDAADSLGIMGLGDGTVTSNEKHPEDKQGLDDGTVSLTGKRRQNEQGGSPAQNRRTLRSHALQSNLPDE